LELDASRISFFIGTVRTIHLKLSEYPITQKWTQISKEPR